MGTIMRTEGALGDTAQCWQPEKPLSVTQAAEIADSVILSRVARALDGNQRPSTQVADAVYEQAHIANCGISAKQRHRADVRKLHLVNNCPATMDGVERRIQ